MVNSNHCSCRTQNPHKWLPTAGHSAPGGLTRLLAFTEHAPAPTHTNTHALINKTKASFKKKGQKYIVKSRQSDGNEPFVIGQLFEDNVLSRFLSPLSLSPPSHSLDSLCSNESTQMALLRLRLPLDSQNPDLMPSGHSLWLINRRRPTDSAVFGEREKRRDSILDNKDLCLPASVSISSLSPFP